MMVLFDLDGTLIDITNRFYSVYCDIMDRYNKPKLTFLEYINCRKRHVSTKSILSKTTNIEDFYTDFIKERNGILESERYLKLDKLYPDSYETLDKLYGNNKMILVTLRMNKINTIKQLKNLSIHSFFNKILIGNHFGDWNTKYDLIKNYHPNIINENAIIVGDTEVDINAGKKLSIKTCFKQGGMRISELVISEKPDFVITNIKEIRGIIDELNKYT